MQKLHPFTAGQRFFPELIQENTAYLAKLDLQLYKVDLI